LWLIGALLAGQNLHAALVAVWGDTNTSAVALPPGLTNVKAVAAGSGFSLALKADGTVAAWGRPDGRNDNALVVPSGLSNVTAVAAGASHALALTAAGRVVAWGYGIFGETNVPADLAKVTAIAAGSAHSLALRSDGTVVAWGSNVGGATNVPAGLADVKAIAAGGDYSLALRQDGTVVGWGSHVPVPEGLSNIIAIAAGDGLSLALQADGRVVAWGGNEYGQTNVPPDLTEVTAIAAGHARGLALKSDGTVAVWGRTLVEPAVPPGLSNVLAIAAGSGNHNLALLPAGPVRIVTGPQPQAAAYASNATFIVVATGNAPLSYQWLRDGQPLSDGGRVQGATTATLVISGVEFADAGTYSVIVGNALGLVQSAGAALTVGYPPQVTSQSPNQTVGAGSFVTLLVTATGTPPLSYQWLFHGTNLPGRTASNLYISNAQPEASGDYTVLVTNAFGTASATIGLLVTNRAPLITQQPFLTATNLRTTVTSPVPIGSSVALNVTAIGSLPLRYQWRLDGVDLPGATNAVLILTALRPEQSGSYSVEIANAFGVTNSAKLLLNVSQVAVAGAPMVGNTNMPLGLSDVTALAAGGSHVMALKSDGTVRTWLANPGYVSSYAVTNIPASATNVVAIAAGSDHCVALRSNGTVVAWGGYPYGQTNVPVGLSNVVGIAAGSSRSYAVRADGTVTNWQGWGTPAGLSNVVAVACGSSQNLALRRDGTVAFWSGTGPFTVVPGLSNAIAVAASSSESRALCDDGTVVRWPATTPTQPTLVMEGNFPVSNAVAIALGAGQTSLILKQDGTVVSEGLGALPVTNNIVGIAAGGVQVGFGVLLVGTGAPAITLQPVSQSVPKSNPVTLHARAVGLPPLGFQWQHDGVNLPGATNASLTLPQAAGRAGGYWLIASNALGAVTSRLAILTVPFATNLPAALNATNLRWSTWSVLASGQSVSSNGWFAQNRETHDDDVAAQSGPIPHGQQSVLETVVTGPGTLSFWWKVSSEAAYDFLRFYWNNMAVPYASMSGETDWQQIRLTLGDGSHRLRWVYVKDATVNRGRDAGWVDEVIFTPAPPRIVQHPVDQTVPAGATVTFQTFASSPLRMTYQWLKNGTNLPGATRSQLTLTNVARRDAGLYAVCVANAGGSVTSSNATLHVLVPQRLERAERHADGSFWLWSADLDGSLLQPSDLPGFEAHASTNLVDWEVLPGALSLTNGWLLLRDTNAPHHPRRFYRIVEP